MNNRYNSPNSSRKLNDASSFFQLSQGGNSFSLLYHHLQHSSKDFLFIIINKGNAADAVGVAINAIHPVLQFQKQAGLKTLQAA